MKALGIKIRTWAGAGDMEDADKPGITKTMGRSTGFHLSGARGSAGPRYATTTGSAATAGAGDKWLSNRTRYRGRYAA